MCEMHDRASCRDDSSNVANIACTSYTEGYRSGHNEAVLKTVCRQARGFESHSLRQVKPKLNFKFDLGFSFLSEY